MDVLFEKYREEEPDNVAVKFYDDYKKAAGKTAKSINITLLSKLEKFNIPELAQLTMTDELELDTIGQEKTALFAVIPDSDTSFNFLVSILYNQLFQILFDQADQSKNGRLPVHVHFVMDEFANIALPNDFQNRLATMRSREISVSIMLNRQIVGNDLLLTLILNGSQEILTQGVLSVQVTLPQRLRKVCIAGDRISGGHLLQEGNDGIIVMSLVFRSGENTAVQGLIQTTQGVGANFTD